jgi:hypothetical protein
MEEYNTELKGLKLKFSKLEETEHAQRVCDRLKEEFKKFEECMELIEALTKEAIVKKANYWKEILQKLEMSPAEQQELSKDKVNLDQLLTKGFMEHIQVIQV